jgi:uncharacterized membrane protein YcaP (DUF421 family)
VEGLTAVVALLVSHHVLSLLRSRCRVVQRLTDRAPLTIVDDGVISGAALRKAHMTTGDLDTVLREHGVDGVSDAERVVLEPRGAFSVIRSSEAHHCP